MFFNRRKTLSQSEQLLEEARTFPKGSMERANLLAEAQLLVLLDVSNSSRAGMWGSLSAGMK